MQQELRWTPFLSLLWREIRRFMKVVVQTVLAPLINSSLYLLIFGVSLGRSIDLGRDVPYLAFLIPGLVMMGCLNNAFSNASSSVVGSKFQGELEDYKVSPLNYSQIVWALGLGGLARGLMVAVVTFIVGQAFYFNQLGVFLSVQNWPLLLLFLSIGGLSFAMMGLSVALWANTFDHLSAFGSFILLPLIYLGGVFYSIDTLPAFWQVISRFNPLLYLINGVRYAILGVSDVSISSAVAMSFLLLFLFYFISFISFKRGSFQRW